MADLENNAGISPAEDPIAAPENGEDMLPVTESPSDALPPEETEAVPTEDTKDTPESSGTTEVGPSAEETPEETIDGEKTPVSGLSGIRLAMELCDRVAEATGLSHFHGGVRPDNISVRDDQVYLGGTLKHGVGEFTPQELEYMAPELFWDGIRTPTADVYSVGLVLYSIYNYGRLPFWPSGGAITPNARASALQKRMSDEPILPPANADAELSAVILRALAFRTEERWHDVREMKEAVRSV